MTQEVYNDVSFVCSDTERTLCLFLEYRYIPSDARDHHGRHGLLVAIFDNNKENRQKYGAIGLVDALLASDNLLDFIAFLKGRERNL
jgi:hypothetical protein